MYCRSPFPSQGELRKMTISTLGVDPRFPRTDLPCGVELDSSLLALSPEVAGVYMYSKPARASCAYALQSSLACVYVRGIET